ncbi:hypothetical protein FG386_002884 [Cryptosporidium ryanae]|uniref:uncharacterized protein n=1 Tax=Cryptosporidium ryanae TaxID=515981 RepID=UPI00351A249F|nr:hypothetical protein FG386_002884 [Cryptosporidium ryanae]
MRVTYNSIPLTSKLVFITLFQLLFFIKDVFVAARTVKLTPLSNNTSSLSTPRPGSVYVSQELLANENSTNTLEDGEPNNIDISSTILDVNDTDLLNEIVSNSESEDVKSTRPSKRYKFSEEDISDLSEDEINDRVNEILNSTMKLTRKGKLADTLLDLKPQIEKRFQDASQSKCYILAVSGGGAKGSHSSGAMNGLAMRYRLLGVKLRWDVVSGVSIGALNTMWKQFYLTGQSAHFTTEGAAIWNFFSRKNVHDCKDDIAQISVSKVVKLLGILNKGPGYLCSSSPISLFMRHIIQNRRRFKGSYWSVLALNYREGIKYLFNEETPITLIPSVIRATTSYPLILEPTEIEGLGVFGDGSIVKAINIQGAINRCFRLGKAKTDNDIVVDIVSTSDDGGHIFTFEPKESKTFLQVISWLFYNYSLTTTYQRYEIAQTIRRFPNIKFRHIISSSNKESIVSDMSVLGFDSKQMATALIEGFDTGFVSASSFEDYWKLEERNINHNVNWRPYNDRDVTVPKYGRSSNTEADAFVEFPTLADVKYKEPMSVYFKRLFSQNKIFLNERIYTLEGKKSKRIRRELYRKKFADFILELHSHLLSIRHIEITREFVRNREYIASLISEREREVKRRMEYMDVNSQYVVDERGNSTSNNENFDMDFGSRFSESEYNIDIDENTNTPIKDEGYDYDDDVEMKELSSIPFFEVSRQYIVSLRTSYVFAYDLVSILYSKEGKRRFKSILKSEKKIRKKLEKSYIKFYELREMLFKLYDRYDKIMKPLNEVHYNLIRLTEKCNYKSVKRNPLLFPFLEGVDSSHLIWAPSEEYDEQIEQYHLDSILTLLDNIYTRYNATMQFSLKLEENEFNHAGRLEKWESYKESIFNYIVNSEESLCWLENENIKSIFKSLEVALNNISDIKKEHFKLVTDITSIHIALANQQVVARFYTATVERLLRKNTIDNLDIIQDIQLKATIFDGLSKLEDEYSTGKDVGEGESSYIRRLAIENLHYVGHMSRSINSD